MKIAFDATQLTRAMNGQMVTVGMGQRLLAKGDGRGGWIYTVISGGTLEVIARSETKGLQAALDALNAACEVSA